MMKEVAQELAVAAAPLSLLVAPEAQWVEV